MGHFGCEPVWILGLFSCNELLELSGDSPEQLEDSAETPTTGSDATLSYEVSVMELGLSQQQGSSS